MGENGAEIISQAIQVSLTLKKIILSFNNIRINGAKSIANALYHNNTLKLLHIGFNKLTDDGVIAISDCFKINNSNNAKLTCIESLDLSAVCLTSQSETAISAIIQEGGLVTLDLSYNFLNASGMYKICNALQVNLKLKKLFLSSNDIGAEGAILIATSLSNNRVLELLCLRDNEILDDGALAIAECLKSNRTLKFLNISWNSLTELGTNEIIETFSINPVLMKLTIDKECFKKCNDELLYNKAVGKWYYLVDSISELHSYQEDIRLSRSWISDNNCSYVVKLT